MSTSFKLLFVAISLLLAVSCNRKATITPPASGALTSQPKNIIIMIGDGMGPAQIAAGMYSREQDLHLEQITDLVTGLHKNCSSDDLVTDSAAGATAFACGKKTYNGAIGVDPDTLPIRTILEEAQSKGYRTGLVATSTIVHATPASFAAHNRQRKNYEEIAMDLATSHVDVLIGGGSKFFREREDEEDLYAVMQDLGYTVSDYFEQPFAPSIFSGADKLAYFTARDSPLMRSQGRDYLPVAARKTVEHLDSLAGDNGFMTVIEGSQIDWGGHANKDYYIISEMHDFDRAIAAIADWSEKDGETLVIITADHETGGLSINKGSVRGDTLVTAFTSDYHTATLIPVFAFGPGAKRFTGIYENTAIYHKLRAALGWQ